MKPGLMNDAPTKVLVVEDEAAAARVLVDEVAAAHGFAVAGHTCSGADALRKVVSDDEIDLVLLDIQLPDISGMDVLRRLRAAGCDVDVMAVTVLRDPSMLQAAMALGVVHYLLKPFTAATVRQKLEHYRAFRARRIAAAGHAIAQQEIEALFNALRAMAVDTLPAGIGQETLHAGARAAAPLGSDVRRASRRDPRRIARHRAAATWSTSPSPGWPDGAPATAGPAGPEVEYRWFGDDASPLPPLPAPDGRPGSST